MGPTLLNCLAEAWFPACQPQQLLVQNILNLLSPVANQRTCLLRRWDILSTGPLGPAASTHGTGAGKAVDRAGGTVPMAPLLRCIGHHGTRYNPWMQRMHEQCPSWRSCASSGAYDETSSRTGAALAAGGGGSVGAVGAPVLCADGGCTSPASQRHLRLRHHHICWRVLSLTQVRFLLESCGRPYTPTCIRCRPHTT